MLGSLGLSAKSEIRRKQQRQTKATFINRVRQDLVQGFVMSIVLNEYMFSPPLVL